MSAAKLIDNHREGAEVYTVAQQCKQKLNELIKAINIPITLFPMEDIKELGYNKTTGFMWFSQEKPVKHKFSKIKSVVQYDTTVSCFIEDGRLRKLQGVKYKLIVWLSIGEMYVEDLSSGNIILTNTTAGVSAPFPISSFDD